VNWPLRLLAYRSTLSSTQILPDSSAMVITSLSWVSESPTGGIHRGTIGRGLWVRLKVAGHTGMAGILFC
jgi:hypothetical protein